MVDGIEIDKKDAEDSLLPEDLNSLAVGSYVVPNPSRRKYYPVYILLVCALFFVASFFLTFINFLPTLIILVLLSSLLLFLNNKFKINQGEVISNVLPYIDHSIGYYSVALTFIFNFKNILTPVWTVIVYSHESPPKFKTIVEINAFSGDIVTEPYSENLNA
tara:strand:+ start:56 stop:541 length:486 start_codon:yes stop_codon:yes gene_type:complete